MQKIEQFAQASQNVTTAIFIANDNNKFYDVAEKGQKGNSKWNCKNTFFLVPLGNIFFSLNEWISVASANETDQLASPIVVEKKQEFLFIFLLLVFLFLSSFIIGCQN